jgi:hypothetical protein
LYRKIITLEISRVGLPFRQFYLFHSKSKISLTAEICFKALLRRQVLKNASRKFRVENVEKNWQPLPEQGRGCPK